MLPTTRRLALLAAIALPCGAVLAQTSPPGVTPPEAIVDARRILMDTIGRNNDFLHDTVDGHFVFDPVEIRARLDAISSMLLAFPHLYRPDTDIWSQAAETADAASVSLSLPVVWEKWDAFAALAEQASRTALDAALATDDLETIRLINTLEGQCESCHQQFRQDRISGRSKFMAETE